MKLRGGHLLVLAGLLSSLIACSRDEPSTTSVNPPVLVEAAAVAAPAPAPDVEWRQHGLTEAETRFSPLADIDAGNVAKLGLAWYFDYPTARGLEATPLVIDGVIYTTGSWSMVFANDATTGELLWFYDPAGAQELGGAWLLRRRQPRRGLR